MILYDRGPVRLVSPFHQGVDEDRFVEAISCAMEKLRWHFLNEED